MPAPKHKQVLNFSIDRHLAEQFRESMQTYHASLSQCYAAAMLMFLEADPETQGQYIKKVFEAELTSDVEAAVIAAKEEQLRRIKAREGASRPKRTP